MTALLVALGAAVGAVLRYLAAHWFDDARFPAGTLVVNVAGSFMLGAFSAMVLENSWFALLGTGFCGGMTTYSTFAVQTHRVGPMYAVLTIGLSLAACALGFWVGQA